VTVTDVTAQKSTPDIPAIEAKFGPMPDHIANRLKPLHQDKENAPAFTPEPERRGYGL